MARREVRVLLPEKFLELKGRRRVLGCTIHYPDLSMITQGGSGVRCIVRVSFVILCDRVWIEYLENNETAHAPPFIVPQILRPGLQRAFPFDAYGLKPQGR